MAANGERDRRRGPAPLASLIAGALDPLTAQRGFASSGILTRWPDIAGERLARHARPLALRFPARGPKSPPGQALPGVLEIAASGAFALELQHAAPQIIARANEMFGWRAVGQIRILQQPLRAARRPAATPAAEPREADRRFLDDVLRKVDDEGLRASLARLGDGVIRRPYRR
jgi:hypothetical protein